MAATKFVLGEPLVHDAISRRGTFAAKIVTILSLLIGLGCAIMWTNGGAEQYLPATSLAAQIKQKEKGELLPSCVKAGGCVRGGDCWYEPGFRGLPGLSSVAPALARKLSDDDDEAKEKPHLSIVICGHIDSGKSTTTGRLVYDLGGIPEREMAKLREEAASLNKQSFAFAFYMDRCKEERARGVTIQCTTKEFYTDNWHYTIIDAPGHADFIKNMISGAAQADVALLMVPADGNFITAIQKGDRKKGEIQGQTRAHARLINLLGCKQLLVGINKMDSDTAAYKEERYKECKEGMAQMLTKVGWKADFVKNSVPFVPISGWHGDNLLTASKNMDWWKGVEVTDKDGKVTKVTTLVDALDKFCGPPARNMDGALRVPISGVYKIRGVGDVLTGRIEQGSLKPGDEVVFLPRHTAVQPVAGKIFSVEMHHKQVPVAGPGDNVGFQVKGLDKNGMPKVGDVLILKSDTSLKPAKTFTAQVQTLENIPNEIKKGYSPIGYVRCGHSACQLVDINWKLGKETGGKKLENPTAMKANEVASIEFKPLQPFVVDETKRCEGLGRIAFLEGNAAAMLGSVLKVSTD